MCQLQHGSGSLCSPMPLPVTLSLAVLHVLRLMASGVQTYLQTVTDSKLMQSPNDTRGKKVGGGYMGEEKKNKNKEVSGET